MEIVGLELAASDFAVPKNFAAIAVNWPNVQAVSEFECYIDPIADNAGEEAPLPGRTAFHAMFYLCSILLVDSFHH